MPAAGDLVRLTRLEAQVFEDSTGTYTQHEQTLWKRTRRLGVGGMGEVFREECIEGEGKGDIRAVKSVAKPNARVASTMDFSKELEAMARFSQPQYQQWFIRSSGWYENTDSVFIAMEYVRHGDLQKHVGSPLEEEEVRVIASQVLEGLAHMHNLGYAHRDLKPANLLIAQRGPRWHIKIADFGISKRVIEGLTSLRTQGGTFGYMAPEVWGLSDDDDDEYDSDEDGPAGSRPSYTSAVDIWALGVIAFVMLTGELPFPASDHRPLKKYVTKKKPFPSDLLVQNGVSARGIAWIENCMAPLPQNRPGAGFSRQHGWLISATSISSTGPRTESSASATRRDLVPVDHSAPSAPWSTQISAFSTVPGSWPDAANVQNARPTTMGTSKPYRTDPQGLTSGATGAQDSGFATLKPPSSAQSGPQILKEIRTISVSSPSVDAMAFSDDGILLAFASWGPQASSASKEQGCAGSFAFLKGWESGSPSQRTYTVQWATRPHITFSSDGRLLAVADLYDDKRTVSHIFTARDSGHHRVMLWDVDNGRELRRWRCPPNAQARVALSPNGQYLAHASSVPMSLVFSQTQGGHRNRITIWDTRTMKEVGQLTGQRTGKEAKGSRGMISQGDFIGFDVAFDSNGYRLASSGITSSFISDSHVEPQSFVSIWDTPDWNKESQRITFPEPGLASSLTFSPSPPYGQLIAFCGCTDTGSSRTEPRNVWMTLWDRLGGGEELGPYSERYLYPKERFRYRGKQDFRGTFTRLVISPNGRYTASVGLTEDESGVKYDLFIWDLVEGSESRYHGITSVAFAPDGTLATGVISDENSKNGKATIKLWKVSV